MGKYFRLVDFDSQSKKEEAFLNAVSNADCGYVYNVGSSNFSKIPGTPLAYWISKKLLLVYSSSSSLSSYARPCKGIDTGDNNRFLRLWFEVADSDRFIPCIEFDSKIDIIKYKWFPYNKGGEYRKWYGNNDYVINWSNNGQELAGFKGSNLRNRDTYFKEGLTWSTVSSYAISMRYFSQGHLFDNGGSCLFSGSSLLYFQGYLNSSLVKTFMELSPTLNFQPGDVGKLPIKINNECKGRVENIVKDNIFSSKQDWDAYETSWDFKRHPLI